MIDYELLNKALKYYAKVGFRQIEVPWRVSAEAINSTFNINLSFKSDNKFLIGSAEQGFLELYLRNKLTSNQLMSVSPCFRNKQEDDLHQQEFIKLELCCITNYEIFRVYDSAMEDVVNFIKTELNISDFEIIKTDDSNSIYSEDIIINDIEYGSYGIRQFQDMYYIYGTGIALPRASKILKSIKEI